MSLSGTDSYSVKTNSELIIQQYPESIPSVNIPPPYNPNTLWGFYRDNNIQNVITSSNPGLIQALGNPNIKQQDIPDSGFNPIALPFEIKYGDEFRFEGEERYTYQVGKIYLPNEGSGSRFTPTGSIEIHFNKNLPISASLEGNFNLDHFLVRRYVDDASQILIKGFRPINSQGPYLIKPEYVTEKLDKNVDDIILLLKEKGIITGDEGIQ